MWKAGWSRPRMTLVVKLGAEIEACDDRMMALNAGLAAADDDKMHNVRLALGLQDGRSALAGLERGVLNGILAMVIPQSSKTRFIPLQNQAHILYNSLLKTKMD